MHAGNISYFPQYVLRTPSFPLSAYLNLLEDYSTEAVLLLFENPFIREAIRIASPELLLSLDKWKEKPSGLTVEKSNGLEITLLKYIARISSRCTPFGLFAGCSVGTIASETTISLEEKEKFTRFTQFDMHFWVALLQDFAKRKEAMHHLTYFPNNSIYSLGGFYRYVEYKYVNTKREHCITALRKSELLEILLLKATSGITVNEMVSLFANDDSEWEEALDFIYQLINFQFLVSELDAAVTGSDEWDRVLKVLSKIPALEDDYSLLQTIKGQLERLDATVTPSQKNYETLKGLIQETGVEFNDKYLFQTDLNIVASANNLSSRIPGKVQQALCFLNGIQKKTRSGNQLNFIKTFNQRYESREMPLVTVLDTEIGIGYLQDSEMNDTHGLLEKFSFATKKKKNSDQYWTSDDYMLQRKLQECLFNKETAIVLTEKDFPDFELGWDHAPSTFSVMVEVVSEGGNETIAIESSGNVSAAKFFGRFCNGNKAVYDLTTEIIEREKAYHADKILAEIVHIPESRTGNILRRPVLRDYEIAYLSNSGVESDAAIPLTDLMISIKNDKIFLRSVKHNKEVIPCLSNAHNYSGRSLPIYHFLCDLQMQELKPVSNFNWGILTSHYDFFPRVYYKDIILSKAKWIVNKTEIEPFYKMEEGRLPDAFLAWRRKRNMPKYVNWVDFDNTLLLDFEKEICVRMFLKSVQRLSEITLEEFLFTEESVVKGANGENFANQFIFSFYKQ